MARKRPERIKSQWAELRAATDWYMRQCWERGVPREEALQSWEDLSIAARIRRWKMHTNGTNPNHPDPPPTEAQIATPFIEFDKHGRCVGPSPELGQLVDREG